MNENKPELSQLQIDQIRSMEKRFSRVKKIGYLSGSFPKGEIPEGFVEKLMRVQKTLLHTLTAGHHVCEYCFPGGEDELQRKLTKGQIKYKDIKRSLSCGDYLLFGKKGYMWPDMLVHYIRDHKYVPPQKFIDTISNYTPSESSNKLPRSRAGESVNWRTKREKFVSRFHLRGEPRSIIARNKKGA